MCVFNVNKPALSLSAKAGQVVLLVVAWFVSLLLPGCVFSPPRLDYSKYTAEQLNDFGVVYEESGNLAEAQRAYSKALEKDPSNHVAASNLGNIYCRKGEYEEAFVHYRKALAIRPGYVPALNNLANAQIETEDYAGAAENLQKALELAETENEKRAIYLSLASLHEKTGDEKEWEKWTEMAEAIKPVTVISDVPFFRQKQHECGPAALACVYNFLGLQQDVEEISKRIYSRKQKGSLNLQLLIDAREQGLTATMYSGSFERIRDAVDDETPLTLMISEGGDSLHYIVVVGYEGDNLSTIVVHDGYRPHKRYGHRLLHH
jgi:tetratricopeptide (TPR) repeat protein